jgi:hypothetical protein
VVRYALLHDGVRALERRGIPLAQPTSRTMFDCMTDAKGSTYVEYVVVVGVLALVATAAVLALGIPLLRFYRFSELVLTMPI